jgi:molybdenum cofactor synthesis domain-containing protein
LALAARRAGAEVIVNAHVRDEEDALRDAFGQALDVADVIVTSGGVSMGDRDLVKGLLGELAEVHIRRIFMKPGKPFNFATSGAKLLFGLPGNPVSCLVGFETFVAPALRVMQGGPADVHPLVSVVLAHDVEPADRIEHQRAVVWANPDGVLMARNTGSQMSARLMSFVGSNAFLVVPPADRTYPAGSRLNAILLGAPYGEPR